MDAPITTPDGSIENGLSTGTTDQLLSVARRLDHDQLAALVQAARDMSEEDQP